ncbi:MAG: hypothetical protein ACMVY4_01465 [Minwuia sp.]|uniref:hypothetical protein n=1 Tax=Minwuia sp. TaxID=2493630 RepID=UPI003A8484C1
MSDDEQPNFRVLKIIVVVLGIAILAMTGIIIYKATELFGGVASGDPAPERAAAAGAAPVVRQVQLPDGPAWEYDIGEGRLIDAQVSDGLILLLVEEPGGVIRAVVLDPATGRTVGRTGGN